MKKSRHRFVLLLMISVLLSACIYTPAPVPEPAIETTKQQEETPANPNPETNPPTEPPIEEAAEKPTTSAESATTGETTEKTTTQTPTTTIPPTTIAPTTTPPTAPPTQPPTAAGLNGFHTVEYSNGDIYAGNFVNGIRSGQGTYTWSNGTVFTGEWVNGEPSANGTYTFPTTEPPPTQPPTTQAPTTEPPPATQPPPPDPTSAPPSVPANKGSSPLIEIKFDSNTKIYGVTAQHNLGKKTGTLEELAKSIVTDKTASYFAFPANFFHAYSDFEVVGGIYSQGKFIYKSWLNWGTGFDGNHKLYLFNTDFVDLTFKDASGNNVTIVTAFNCYPWLVKNGVREEIRVFPGVDEKYLNSKSQRAYMGQKADGTFVYGIVGSATIRELQDICVNLGLVNAVNTDGGASAGLYKDGKYVSVPGRELASAVVVMQMQ